LPLTSIVPAHCVPERLAGWSAAPIRHGCLVDISADDFDPDGLGRI